MSSARVLVINNDPVDTINMTQKLHARGYENVPLKEKADALDQVRASKPDIVIIAGSGNAGSSLNLTRALKGRNETAAVPVILITSSDRESSLVEGLRAGADACLPYPYHDLQLYGRIESLTRLGAMQEELRRRIITASKYGLKDQITESPPAIPGEEANFLLVGPSENHFGHIEQGLFRFGTLTHAQSPVTGIHYLERQRYDAVLLNIPEGQEAVYFQFVEDIRRNSRLFNIPIVCMMSAASTLYTGAAYTAGAADVFYHPLNLEDFSARVEVLFRQQRYRNSLIKVYRQTRDLSISDALTGLYSHGFMMEHLSELVAESHAQNRSLSLAVFSFDNLTEINSLYGFNSGDRILSQLGVLLSNLVRGEDLSARYSGHQFALVMPETRLASAEMVAHRIGSIINFTEIMQGDVQTAIRAHVTTGVAALSPGMSADALVKAAIANGR